MKTHVHVSLSITGLKATNLNLDEFKFETQMESENTPEEQMAAVNNIGRLLTTMVYDLAKPSAQVGKEPHPIMDEKPDDVPDGHDCTHESYHLDCGFCRARHSRHICMKCHTEIGEPFSDFCNKCQGGN